MTVVTTVLKGFGETDFGEEPFDSGVNAGNLGMQAEMVIIDSETPLGMQALLGTVVFEKPYGMQGEGVISEETPLGVQAEGQINDFETPIGQQAEGQINDFEKPYGMQAEGQVNPVVAYGMQAEGSNVGFNNPVGMQAEMNVLEFLKPVAFEAKSDFLQHLTCPVWAEGPFGETPFDASCMKAIMAMRALMNVGEFTDEMGMQALGIILDTIETHGMQAAMSIVDYLHPAGMQADMVTTRSFGMQATSAIYNTTNLRILCDFPSRGTTGLNWTANSTEPGDFDVNNVNTDITEEIWRSATGVTTGLTFDCDTEIPQGVFLDTFAIINHNLTSSAQVFLIGSNNASHAPTGIIIPIQVTDDNLYYISPDLPLTGYRYWRIAIDDGTNSDGFVSLGTVLFGATRLFSGECFVDEIEFEHKDFSDKVLTQGHTNVSNSLALKRVVALQFRLLRTLLGNFELLRDVFKVHRTTHKCLWIPTPSATDMEVTDRYAVFGKLTVLPRERHKSLGPDKDYASFDIEIDESM